MVQMKEFYLKTILILCLVSPVLCLSNTVKKPVLAVFDLKNVLSQKSRNGNIFSLFLTTKLSTGSNISLVERELIDKIIKERKLSHSGLVKQDYLQLAALVNADYIITGRIYTDRDEGMIYINLKLTKCANGKIFGKSFSTPINNNEKFLEKIADKAAVFINTSLGKTKQ
jgi:hypothetical protein